MARWTLDTNAKGENMIFSLDGTHPSSERTSRATSAAVCECQPLELPSAQRLPVYRGAWPQALGMDYSLKSLRDAFNDTAYKRSRRGYDLYALLLATTLDQEFVFEYLSFYHELDFLTGERVLIIGPQLAPPEPTTATTSVIRYSQLHELRVLFAREASDRSFPTSRTFDFAEQFLAFMQEQTRESYAFGRFLGVPGSSMPMLVFFDNLDRPSNRVEWRLEGRSGHQFVRDLRDILEVVSDERGWERSDQHAQLEQARQSPPALSVVARALKQSASPLVGQGGTFGFGRPDHEAS